VSNTWEARVTDLIDLKEPARVMALCDQWQIPGKKGYKQLMSSFSSAMLRSSNQYTKDEILCTVESFTAIKMKKTSHCRKNGMKKTE
jgi:hypothetical protein